MMPVLNHLLLVLLFSAFAARGQQGAAEGGAVPAERFQVTKDVKFLLYTKRNPSSAQTIVLEDHVTSLGNFNKLHETKLVIHGWMSSASKLDAIRAGYMAAGDDYNVIEVDWSAGASTLYPMARGYVE
ncbi:inactive pancreatic lipase-related protein 1-like [Bacillus rossius redtenbacheri]|uniref:inactive pancreatic lipase-related protein 1-like n=1 Tax=Bacillus rossius redtenbacheri TaxID=93214 RepID=UPI002FDE3878